MEEAFPAAGDRSVVVRRKRMKRQRPPSPLWSSGGGAGAASSSSSGGDFSPPSSSSGSTEEEEDMAHCLILLAQGPRPQRQLSPEGSEARAEMSVNGFRSKKFSEVVAASTDATSGANSSTVAKAGFYVYECKTCSRVFPSFQALGGHRASHKKPKHTAGAAEDVKKSPASPGSSREDYDDEGRFGKTIALTPPTNPVQISCIAVSKPKIHECSICGTEFTSGQALGGHMRRHRAMAAPTGAQVTVLGLESSIVSENGFHIDEKSRDVLSLDLNLPAPPEDEHQHLHHHRRREVKLQLVTPSSQAPPLMFSSPALVDCHY